MSTSTESLTHDAEQARRALLGAIDVEDHRLELAGISTAVLAGGDGPPIVLLHGPGEFTERWAGVIPALAEHHRVIAPDLPGHGRSGTHPGGLDTDRLFDWLDALLATCDEPAVLVGHILGGSLAARYAAARPGRVARLVLVDSLGLTKFRPSPRFAIGLIGFMAHPSPSSHKRFMRQCLADDDTVRSTLGARWDALRDYSIDRARDPGVKAAMKACMSEVGVPPIPDEQLAAITVPTTLIWGRHDKANKLARAEAVSARLGWPLRVIEDCADDPPTEQPAAFVDAVLAAAR